MAHFSRMGVSPVLLEPLKDFTEGIESHGRNYTDYRGLSEREEQIRA